MREIGGSTHVTYPSGEVSGRSPVLLSAPLDGGYGIVTHATPFHPLDPSWPDQPADSGLIQAEGMELKVADCLTGAVPLDPGPGSGVAGDAERILLGADIPVRRGEGGWAWLVVHVVERHVPESAEALLFVDPVRRRALSAGHTACHVTALALNAALAPRWREPARTDGLGRPDFDALAIVSSRIVERGSRDVYRVGRSLRRAGFTAEGLADDLPGITATMNGLLASWVAADAPVRIDAPSPELAARRTWRCDLPEGTVEMPCGGTHLDRLGELASVTASLELSPEGDELVVETRATGPALSGEWR
ncbi:metal-dependent hydrolase [Actinomadura yumaensis]|uniref:Metal-dependent hydrolase n=1 Tax=Actinomadura yumaensis TaxID=111807 RepID=A0ABW2CSJ5_9ACTN